MKLLNIKKALKPKRMIPTSDNMKAVIVTTLNDKEILVYDVNTNKWISTNNSASINPLCLTTDDNFIVSGSDDCKIKIWELHTLKCIRVRYAHFASLSKASFALREC